MLGRHRQEACIRCCSMENPDLEPGWPSMILNILLFDERQGHYDRCSPAWLTLHPDAALMQQYNLLHDGKPHAAAAIFAAV
ncbi:hypothetical protein D3C85_1787590 [compost metagenome]